METIIIEAKSREKVGHNSNFLRTQNMIPAALYGHNLPNQNLAVAKNAFLAAYKSAGESTLIDLKIEGRESVKVLVHDTQIDPLSGEIIHIDFYQVSMAEKLETEVSLNYIGESPAVKNFGAILVKSVDRVRVKCLPGDLVRQIDVDLNALANFGDVIHIKDIKLSHGIELLEHAEDVIATVTQPISEEELKAMEAKPEADVTAIKTEGEEKRAEKEAEKSAESEAE
jgi:large subunit ribosomal protein L25